MHLRIVPPSAAPAFAALALAAGARAAWAHPGVPPAPHDLWGAWSWEPGVVFGIWASAWLYTRGVERLWRRAGVGRGVRRWQCAAFAAGLLVLLVALISPLDALGSALFSAHMVQHEVLILVAAPLLVLGVPLIPFLWALPPRWRTRLGRWSRARPVRASWRTLTHPASAWGLHATALWVWHAPGLYQATLRSDVVHAAQHASFLGTALLFWWVLLHSGRRMGHGVAVLYVFTTGVYGSILGALLTFAPRPWYPAYAGSVRMWGLSLLEDQQLGGLIMWIPGGVVYLGVALALFAAWLRAVEESVRRSELRRAVYTAAAVALVFLVAGCGGEARQSALHPAGVQAREVAWLWWAMFTLATGVCITVTGFLLYGLFRARERRPDERNASDAQKARVVAAGVGATVLILVLVFALSLVTGRTSAPHTVRDALTVEVTGYRFWWEVRYPGAGVVTANEIHIPVGRTVLFRVRAADVIHSFWVPNLHGKIDMIPGRTNQIWARAEETGTFRGQCAEFCGIQHANMALVLVVHEPAEFEAWLAHQQRPAPEPRDPVARAGREVFMRSACAECHAVQGTPAEGRDGPDLTHVASRLTLAAGMLPNTEGHLGGWITNPQRIKPGNNMPAVPLAAEEFRALLHYMQTLR